MAEDYNPTPGPFPYPIDFYKGNFDRLEQFKATSGRPHQSRAEYDKAMGESGPPVDDLVHRISHPSQCNAPSGLDAGQPPPPPNVTPGAYLTPVNHSNTLGGGDAPYRPGELLAHIPGHATLTTAATGQHTITQSSVGNSRPSSMHGQPNTSSKSPNKRKRKRPSVTYACPFNKFMKKKFRPRRGSQGHDRFSSCEGPGWADIRHLGDHIQKVHRYPQCTRCWKTWETEEELMGHLNAEPRVDCPDHRQEVRNIESVTADVFSEIKKALSTPRARRAIKLSDDDKWYTVKNLIFPPAKYPDFPNPRHPYFQDPDDGLTVPPPAERDIFCQWADRILQSNAETAVKDRRISNTSEYLMTMKEVKENLMMVYDVWIKTKSPHSTTQPTQRATANGVPNQDPLARDLAGVDFGPRHHQPTIAETEQEHGLTGDDFDLLMDGILYNQGEAT